MPESPTVCEAMQAGLRKSFFCRWRIIPPLAQARRGATDCRVKHRIRIGGSTPPPAHRRHRPAASPLVVSHARTDGRFRHPGESRDPVGGRFWIPGQARDDGECCIHRLQPDHVLALCVDIACRPPTGPASRPESGVHSFLVATFRLSAKAKVLP